jgi:hypothetical protein
MLQSHARPRKSRSHIALDLAASLPELIAFAFTALIAWVILAPTGASAAAQPVEPTKSGIAGTEVVEADSLALPTDSLLERALHPEAKPLDPEFQAVLDRERAELDRLLASFENAPDHAAAIAAQLAIDSLKQHTEIELLQIQARRMRERGLEQQATELEQSLAAMLERLPRRSDGPAAPSSADPR